MTTYRVRWEIDVDAVSPEEAARVALEVQRDEESIATVFTVQRVAPAPVRAPVTIDAAPTPPASEGEALAVQAKRMRACARCAHPARMHRSVRGAWPEKFLTPCTVETCACKGFV